MKGLVKESFAGRSPYFAIHSADNCKWPKHTDWPNVTLSSLLDKICQEIKHTVHISSLAHKSICWSNLLSWGSVSSFYREYSNRRNWLWPEWFPHALEQMAEYLELGSSLVASKVLLHY